MKQLHCSAVTNSWKFGGTERSSKIAIDYYLYISNQNPLFYELKFSHTGRQEGAAFQSYDQVLEWNVCHYCDIIGY